MVRMVRNMKDPRNRMIGDQDETYIMTMHCRTISCTNIKRVWCRFEFRR